MEEYTTTFFTILTNKTLPNLPSQGGEAPLDPPYRPCPKPGGRAPRTPRQLRSNYLPERRGKVVVRLVNGKVKSTQTVFHLKIITSLTFDWLILKSIGFPSWPWPIIISSLKIFWPKVLKLLNRYQSVVTTKHNADQLNTPVADVREFFTSGIISLMHNKDIYLFIYLYTLVVFPSFGGSRQRKENNKHKQDLKFWT